METFTQQKEFVENPYFQAQKQEILDNLTDEMIDAPIVEIVKGLNTLPYCFTLQSCYGHFVYDQVDDPHNLQPLPKDSTITTVEYRIAYLALCIDNSSSGRKLLEELKGIASFDPENVQFCCAEWFWRKQVNSYVLQVEPERFKHLDTAIIDYGEALQVERTRNGFFLRLKRLLPDNTNR